MMFPPSFKIWTRTNKIKPSAKSFTNDSLIGSFYIHKGSLVLEYKCCVQNWSQSIGSLPACDLVINWVEGCHYFPPGLQLLSQPKSMTAFLAGTKLYCLMTEAHMCKWLDQGHYVVVLSQDSNPQPVNRKSDAPPMVPPFHSLQPYHDK